jgi:hypothetical protein
MSLHGSCRAAYPVVKTLSLHDLSSTGAWGNPPRTLIQRKHWLFWKLLGPFYVFCLHRFNHFPNPLLGCCQKDTTRDDVLTQSTHPRWRRFCWVGRHASPKDWRNIVDLGVHCTERTVEWSRRDLELGKAGVRIPPPYLRGQAYGPFHICGFQFFFSLMILSNNQGPLTWKQNQLSREGYLYQYNRNFKLKCQKKMTILNA